MKKLIPTCLLLIGFLIASSQVTVTFPNPTPSAPVNCLDSWSENGIPMQIVPIPPSTSCSFIYSGGNLGLFPARLVADLSSFSQIDSIQIKYQDGCGVGCTQFSFLAAGVVVDNAANTTVNMDESYTFINSSNQAIDELFAQSFEGFIHDFTVYYTPCPVINQVEVEDGDIYVEESCHGIILKSNNGSCFRIRVNDDGSLTTEMVTCP